MLRNILVGDRNNYNVNYIWIAKHIEINRNVLNVDEPAQLITVETSLRMTWTDPRLNVTLPSDSPTDYIRFGSGVVRHIWFPDVYIDGIQDLRSPAYKVSFHCISTMLHLFTKIIHFFQKHKNIYFNLLSNALTVASSISSSV